MLDGRGVLVLAGEQVYATYGARGNDDFFLFYGTLRATLRPRSRQQRTQLRVAVCVYCAFGVVGRMASLRLGAGAPATNGNGRTMPAVKKE